ncbi:LysR family transcriptional regulator [Pelagovum sp. HNIBRBA483]|uniref:LysR family transcriptional regulator n=1 Tax=Pelagovum sp. HNIBRBA483 TaxID=3233341 RepID=UPI0034A3647D
MENWDEVRTAYQVARLGTVSGAADALGVHHATVIRHIDALEARLGVKLFQRHARGYTATEAGMDLLRVAQATDDQFAQLAGRIRGQGDGVTGELVVTSIVALAPQLTPIILRFQQENPGLLVRYLTGERLFRLEYGEAHVAIRAGTAPQEPDNVVQPFVQQQYFMVAAPEYIERHGLPKSEEELSDHWFVGHDSENNRAPFMRWLSGVVPRERVVFRTTEDVSSQLAILSGAGIGFLPCWTLREHPEMVQILPPKQEWSAPLWLVTHVDLHRTAKVQAFLAALKASASGWTQV